jgi:hypothetical protein
MSPVRRLESQTINLNLIVRGALPSVIQWWTDPERLAERRSKFEARNPREFVWHESVGDGVRVIASEWKTKWGELVYSETRQFGWLSAQILPDSTEHTLRATVSATFHHPNRPDRTIETRQLYEFSPTKHGHTRLEHTTEVLRGGWNLLSLWVCRRPQKAALLKDLSDSARRCEAALAGQTSAKN